MAERIRVARAVNRILWPELRVLGFRFQYPDEGEAWKEGRAIFRTGAHGREQGLIIGRDKFGHLFGLNVARQLPDDSWDYMDVRKVGLSREALSYSTEEQLEAVLRRVVEAVQGYIVPWLDEDPPTTELSWSHNGTASERPSNNALNLPRRC